MSEFEIAFLTMMSEHHAMAVAEGRDCLRAAEHRELRSLCRNIVSTQLREIAQLESWLPVVRRLPLHLPPRSATHIPDSAPPQPVPMWAIESRRAPLCANADWFVMRVGRR